MKDPKDPGTIEIPGLDDLVEQAPPAAPVYPDSFADYPMSVSHVRGSKSNAPRDWTPRDVLIQALRELDNGTIQCDALVVLHLKITPTGAVRSGYKLSSPNWAISQALLAAGRIDMEDPT